MKENTKQQQKKQTSKDSQIITDLDVKLESILSRFQRRPRQQNEEETLLDNSFVVDAPLDIPQSVRR